jgi:hypothetical protein
MDWNGGGRAPATECRGERQAASRTGQAGPEAFFGGRNGAAMRVRFKTTAGTHKVGATFLATEYAPLLDLDRRFKRSTIQTWSDAGIHLLPARRHDPRRRDRITRRRPTSSPSRPQDLRVHAGASGRRRVLRATHRAEPRGAGLPSSDDGGRR